MAKINVKCPICAKTEVIKHGITEEGKQRYQCKNQSCAKNTFILDYTAKGRLPEIKEKIIEMTLNGSGIRDISRVLKISTRTVLKELKKKGKKVGIS